MRLFYDITLHSYLTASPVSTCSSAVQRAHIHILSLYHYLSLSVFLSLSLILINIHIIYINKGLYKNYWG